MAHSVYASHNMHIEVLFEDTNNVCICSRAHLSDFENPSNESVNRADVFEDYNDEYKLMKELGLPTSFAYKNSTKFCYYDDYDYYDNDEIESYSEEENYDYYDDCNEVEYEIHDYSRTQSDAKDIEEEWQNYWTLHGNTIIFNSWIQKYKDYLNPEYLNSEEYLNYVNQFNTNCSSQNPDESLSVIDSTNTADSCDNECFDPKLVDNFQNLSLLQEKKVIESEGVAVENGKGVICGSDVFLGGSSHATEELSGFSEQNTNALVDNTEDIEFSKLREELESIYPSLFEKRKSQNPLFTCSESPKESTEEEIPSAATWQEYWTVHSQEQYDMHYKMFIESRVDKSSSNNLCEPNDHKVEICSFCGEYNCDYCVSNEYENEIYNFAALNTCPNAHCESNSENFETIKDSLSYSEPGNSNLKKNTSESFVSDDPSISSIFSVDEMLQVLDESADMEQEENNSDDDPPLEIPIAVVKENADENKPTEPIKQMGFIVEPDTSVRIKKCKRHMRQSQRKRKRFASSVPCTTEDQEMQDSEQNEADAGELQNTEDLNDSGSSREKCKVLDKYWHQRYRLFQRYDEGIKLDEESWFSVTPEEIARHIAERCACDVIVDALCGAGGNAIQFALTCSHVIAVDIDPKKIELAKHNAAVYGVQDKIDFIVGDFLAIGSSLKADTVFLSPPWGGPKYIQKRRYDISRIKPDIYKLFEVANQISKNVALFVPKNTVMNQLVQLAGRDSKIEIEQNVLNKKVKTITAYYGSLVKLDPDDSID